MQQICIWFFDNFLYPFLEGVGCVCVKKPIPSTAAAVKTSDKISTVPNKVDARNMIFTLKRLGTCQNLLSLLTLF